MTTLDVRADQARVDQAVWFSDEVSRSQTRLRDMLPVLAGVCLMVVDVGVVVGAFLLAHWLRFVAAADETSALGLEHYALMGLTIGGIVAGLLAMQIGRAHV